MRAVTLLLCLDELICYSDRSVWSSVLDIVMLHLAVGGSSPPDHPAIAVQGPRNP